MLVSRANKGKNPGADWHPKKGVTSQYMGVSKNRGTPKWMVLKENSIKMDDLGIPLFLETSI